MSFVKQLHELTTEMYDKLQNADSDREQLVKDITAFVRKRETIIKDVKPPYTEEEKKLGQELVQMDQQIQAVFENLLSGLKGSMRQIQNKKRNNTKYVNPYQNVSTVDGMFFDKKN